jgi:hypothetical protein
VVACKYMMESGGWSCNIAKSDRTGKASKRRRGQQKVNEGDAEFGLGGMSSKGSGIGCRLPKLHGLSGSWTRCMVLRALDIRLLDQGEATNLLSQRSLC